MVVWEKTIQYKINLVSTFCCAFVVLYTFLCYCHRYLVLFSRRNVFMF